LRRILKGVLSCQGLEQLLRIMPADCGFQLSIGLVVHRRVDNDFYEAGQNTDDLVQERLVDKLRNVDVEVE
jgi:hypothetical protein